MIKLIQIFLPEPPRMLLFMIDISIALVVPWSRGCLCYSCSSWSNGLITSRDVYPCELVKPEFRTCVSCVTPPLVSVLSCRRCSAFISSISFKFIPPVVVAPGIMVLKFEPGYNGEIPCEN